VDNRLEMPTTAATPAPTPSTWSALRHPAFRGLWASGGIYFIGNAMQAMAAEWTARHGVPDLVIANAGVAGGYDTGEADDLAVFRRMLEINLLGAATTFQPFLRAMQAERRGAMVGVASLAGWRGLPGNGAYCASKAGLIRYLESLRAELRGSGLTVHTVSPGYIRTALTAGNQFAMPGLLDADVAARRLLQGVASGREHIVLPRRIGWLSRALACLPTSLHDRILRGQPRKPRCALEIGRRRAVRHFDHRVSFQEVHRPGGAFGRIVPGTLEQVALVGTSDRGTYKSRTAAHHAEQSLSFRARRADHEGVVARGVVRAGGACGIRERRGLAGRERRDQ
jgi:short-subunit dehydrogenase